MKNKIRYLIISSLFLLVGFSLSTTALAEENKNGGQVTVDGTINFYEESEEPPDVPDPSEPQPSEPAPEDPAPDKKDPPGSSSDSGKKLPQTGETIRNFSLIGGTLILFVLIILFRRKKNEGGES